MPRKSEKFSPKLDETKNEPNSIGNPLDESMKPNLEVEAPKEILQVNDIVWAKIKGYPFWPARITELVYRKSSSEPNSVRKKSSNEPKEYKVIFFGGDTTGPVFKDNIKLYDCKEKTELIAKYSKNSKMTRAIQEAEQYLTNLKIDVKEKIEKNLLTMDEELKLIKNAIDLKSENLTEKIERSAIKSKNLSLSDSKKKLPIQINKLCHKKEQRSSAIRAAKNLSFNSTPSQLKQQKEKISKLTGDDLDSLCSSAKKTYELIKSSTKVKEKNSKKRNRSLDITDKDKNNHERIENSKKKCLNKHFESDDEELNFCVTNDKDKFESTNTLYSGPSSPVDLSLDIETTDNFKFSSMTLLIDSSLTIYKKYILKLIEVFYEMIIELNKTSSIRICDINREESDLKNDIELKLNEIKEKCRSKINLDVTFENELNKSTFGNEIIFSFIKQPKTDNSICKAYENFEKQVLSSKFDELKVVSFCPINYEEVIIYHHHFKSNKGLFIEAPIFQVGNFSKILVACLDQEFFESLKHVFNSLFEAENVINEGDELGYPSIFCQSIQNYVPVLKLCSIISNKVMNLIPQLMAVTCVDKKSDDLEMDQIKNKFKDKIVKESVNVLNAYLEKNQTEIEIENKNEIKLELSKLLDSL